MAELADVLPIVAAAVALLAGVLLGKQAVRRYAVLGKLQVAAILSFVGLLLFGNKVAGAVVFALLAAGVQVITAKYIGVSVLCFLSGAVMSLAWGRK